MSIDENSMRHKKAKTKIKITFAYNKMIKKK